MYYSTADFNIFLQEQTVEEAVGGGVHQLNLCFCVLLSSLLRDKRNILKKDKENIGQGSKSRLQPKWPLSLCTLQEPVERHKVLFQVSIFSFV